MRTKQYLERLLKLLKPFVTDRDHRKAMGAAGGVRGPKGVEAEELVGMARITPRTVRENTDEELYDLHELLCKLASSGSLKKKQVCANAYSFVREELIRRGHEMEEMKFNVDVGDVHVNQLLPEVVDDEVSMPFPNEHACRISSPGQFTRFRRNNSTNPHTIIGFKPGGGSGLQSFRYPTSSWTVERARTHCQRHEGSFAAASKQHETDEE